MKVVLSERQKRLIDLLKSDVTVPGGDIANLLNVTTRTVRNDVKRINDLIGNRLINGDWNGYSINEMQLSSIYPEINFLDKAQLHQQILQKLILNNQDLNLYDLANSLYISPSTLSSHLKEISNEMEEQHLRLEIKDSHINLIGSELNRRRMITRLIFNDINNMFFSLEKLADFFSNIDIFVIQDIVLKSMDQFELYASDIYRTNLVINIGITFNRILNGFSIDHTPIRNYDNTGTTEYQAACYIVEEFQKVYHHEVSQQDILYISLLILGQTKRYLIDSSIKHVRDLLSEEFTNKIREILIYTFNYFMLKTNYEEFFLNFALHVNFLIVRSSIGNSVANSYAQNIKINYPFIYDISVFIAHRIENTFSIKVDDYEIGFLALHIGAALISSNKDESEKTRLVLVGGERTGLMDGIGEKIKAKYKDSITLSEIIPNLNENNINADILYVSILPNPSMLENVITISPFLSQDDFLKLDNAINRYEKRRNKRQTKQLILTYFREELFFHNLKFSNKYDIIRFLGDKTVQYGIAKKGFTSSVIKREDMSSTCFFDTFAIPHAIELNAFQTSFSILTTDELLPWDDKNIKIIFMIAVSQSDRKEFEKIYHGIIDILCDPQSVLQLSQAATYIDFINCINQML